MKSSDGSTSLIDRGLQRDLLMRMAAVYPRHFNLNTLPPDYIEDRDRVIANVHYLIEHGLCFAEKDGTIGWEISLTPPRITHRGLDFISPDGGLQAILSAVTVRLDADTIRALISKEIDDAPTTEDEKGIFRKQLETLPETALRTGTGELLKAAFQHLPNAAHWLRIFLNP